MQSESSLPLRKQSDYFYLWSENSWDGFKHLHIGFSKFPHEEILTKKEFFEDLNKFINKSWKRIDRFQKKYSLQSSKILKIQATRNYKVRWKIFKRDNFTCQKCGCQEDLELDHIIPLSQGGEDKEDNMQTLCKKCNVQKMHSQKDN